MDSMDPVRISIGKALGAARQKQRLSKSALARKAVVSRRTLQNWEAGTWLPDPCRRDRYAAALGKSREELDAILSGCPT